MLDDIPRRRDAFVLKLGLLECVVKRLVPGVRDGVPLLVATKEVVRLFPLVLADRECSRRRLRLTSNDDERAPLSSGSTCIYKVLRAASVSLP